VGVAGFALRRESASAEAGWRRRLCKLLAQALAGHGAFFRTRRLRLVLTASGERPIRIGHLHADVVCLPRRIGEGADDVFRLPDAERSGSRRRLLPGRSALGAFRRCRLPTGLGSDWVATTSVAQSRRIGRPSDGVSCLAFLDRSVFRRRCRPSLPVLGGAWKGIDRGTKRAHHWCP
jgi:hypothetical protein